MNVFKTLRIPAPNFFVDQFRIIVTGYFIYKLLSRDFSLFGRLPDFLMDNYPWDSQGWVWYPLSPGWLVDIGTFHFIYWVLPFPSAAMMTGIQFATIGVLAAVLLFGRGPRGLLALSSFVLLSHLWGFYWRTGADVDAVWVQLQLILWYGLLPVREDLTLPRPRLNFDRSEDTGLFFSVILLVFVVYYFFSGLNKLSDISIIDWFRYDLAYHMELVLDLSELQYMGVNGAHAGLLEYEVFTFMVNKIGVPLVYFSHLIVPLMFFDRTKIPVFWNFYMMFHIMAVFAGASFFGLMLVWFVFTPFWRFFQPVVLTVQDPNGRWPGLVRRIDLFRRVTIIAGPKVSAWRPDDGPGAQRYNGSHVWRVLVWPLLPCWPLLPLLYAIWYWIPLSATRSCVGLAKRFKVMYFRTP